MSAKYVPRFFQVFCSQCGRTFPAADHGYSSCKSHKGLLPVPVWMEGKQPEKAA